MIGERRVVDGEDLVVTVIGPGPDDLTGDRPGRRHVVERSQEFVEVTHGLEAHPPVQAVSRLDEVEAVDPDVLRQAVARAAQLLGRPFDAPPEERSPHADPAVVRVDAPDQMTTFEPLGRREVVGVRVARDLAVAQRDPDVGREHDAFVVDVLTHLVQLQDPWHAVECFGPVVERAQRFEVVGHGPSEFDGDHVRTLTTGRRDRATCYRRRP